MAQPEREVIGAEIKRLEALLAKRRSRPGLGENVRYIEEQLAHLYRDLDAAKAADG